MKDTTNADMENDGEKTSSFNRSQKLGKTKYKRGIFHKRINQ